MSTPRLQVKQLTVRFGKAFTMGPLKFDAEHGVIHLVGPNGSGKTTALRAMCGELLPASGQVLVEGVDVHRVPSARRRIALVPSTPELPPFLTVREAWQFTCSLRGAPAWDGSALCDALALPPHLPLGHGSAGQRRKAELICALAGDPSILLLDETFAHLDRDAVQWLATYISDAARDRLVLLTHHGEAPVPVAREIQVVAVPE
ncbi:MAG: ABC transporter ATP-binding protein [Pseudomonadota bacterium]